MVLAMTSLETAVTPAATPAVVQDGAHEPALVVDDLVEEVSIDGMCGVY